MKRISFSVAVVLGFAVVLSVLLPAPVAVAGNQDFTLVNHTGFDVYSVYVAPANSDEWSYDLLGDTIMQDEGRRFIEFSNQNACRWDLLAVDGYGDQVVFRALNLCQSYKVILVCKEQGCWADTE